jgi:microcin C transport system substrate-binding protein
MVTATTRPDLSATTRALDRVLTWSLLGAAVLRRCIFDWLQAWSVVLPAVIPPYYDAGIWAMGTWWASGKTSKTWK